MICSRTHVCHMLHVLIVSFKKIRSCSFRPKEISEKEFGQKWKAFHSEKKLKILSHSLKSTSDFMNMVSTQFNFYPVKIIGMYVMFIYTKIHQVISPAIH